MTTPQTERGRKLVSWRPTTLAAVLEIEAQAEQRGVEKERERLRGRYVDVRSNGNPTDADVLAMLSDSDEVAK